MTKPIDGALFEEPVVVVGCPDYKTENGMVSGWRTQRSFARRYKAREAMGVWRGKIEHCSIFSLDVFTAALNGECHTDGHMLRQHLTTEECISIFYRLPRNPKILMCALRQSPRIFSVIWRFIPNEDTDKVAKLEQYCGQDGLILPHSGGVLHA